MASSKECSLFKKEKEIVTLKVKKNISYPEARRMVSAPVTPFPTSFATVAKKVSTSVATQTAMTWPHGEKTPKPVSPVKLTNVSASTSTQTESADNVQLSSFLPASTKDKYSNKNNSNKSSNKININVGSKTKNPSLIKSSNKQKSTKPSGPEERPSKATRDPIQTFNRFESFEDLESSAVGEMDTSPAPGRSASLSPKRGRPRSKFKFKSPLRLPP